MFRQLVSVLMLSIVLAGCDKVQEFVKKQTEFEQRVENIEEQLNSIKEQVSAAKQETQASAASFNGCVLENMRGINSDLAAESIKESCLRKVSRPLPDLTGLSESKAGYGQIYGYLERSFGLYITLNNSTSYTITEITMRSGIKKRMQPICMSLGHSLRRRPPEL
jgi:outer membrane murein-binding lipoprotein Lpp